MKRNILLAFYAALAPVCFAQTDTYIKLHDTKAKHPRVLSITYPGNSNRLDMYNSIYGHGAVIENPWVAYRVYMDNRQSLDLYVKQTPQIELDVTGFYTTPEQLEAGYGCDVLWAGKSVGAGSFRGWDGKNPLTIDSVASRTQTVVSDHEIIAADKDWIVNGHPVQMTQKYSVLPDSRDLFVEISLEGYEPDDTFCTGVQKLEMDNEGFLDPKGVAASWGRNIPDKKYKDWIETVGLSIVVDPVNLAGTVEDEVNYLMLLKPDKDGKIRYRVIACGSREKDGFKNSDEWFNYIRNL